jgi:protocatechuate 3,4-dioxygenase alpha subunit
LQYNCRESTQLQKPALLALVPVDRRNTLIVARELGNGGAIYRSDIRLQGDNETVFFDV